jgi:hypothetical protein
MANPRKTYHDGMESLEIRHPPSDSVFLLCRQHNNYFGNHSVYGRQRCQNSGSGYTPQYSIEYIKTARRKGGYKVLLLHHNDNNSVHPNITA